MKFRTSWALHLACVGATALGVCGFLAVLGWMARPDLGDPRADYDPQEVAEVRQARAMELSLDDPPVLFQDVDYSRGEAASWWPKGEAPVLRELVEAGDLEPVAERVGPEPVVLRGIDGVGRYGGTIIRVGQDAADVKTVSSSRMAYGNLVRWSPQGSPLVPHIAKSWTVSPDKREFIFELRKGVRWSDGEPYDADDIMYWWDNEAHEDWLHSVVPEFMSQGDVSGQIEKLGPYKVKFTFPRPHGLFLELVGFWAAREMANCPEHYLRQYHPKYGDPDFIQRSMEARGLPSAEELYREIKSPLNPEHPRLWPWVCRAYRSNPPYTFVRNPYYPVVDAAGNQLPYIDRVVYQVKAKNMIPIAASNGEITFQGRHLSFKDYTDLMGNQQRNGYRVLHWYSQKSEFTVFPNINRRVEAGKPETKWKRKFLRDKRFRQALSLALDREKVIEAEYSGQITPAQIAPRPGSRFYLEGADQKYVEHDPDRANDLLDALGLTQRDRAGYRTFPDGSRMSFFLELNEFTGAGPAQLLVDDWKKVGVRVTPRMRSRNLFGWERASLEHDLDVWSSGGFLLPLLDRGLVEGPFCPAYENWRRRGGLYGDPKAKETRGCKEPPPGSPVRTAMELYDRIYMEPDPQRQKELYHRILGLASEQCWSINIGTPPPQLMVCDADLRNVPETAMYLWTFQSPANTGPETFYFADPQTPPGARAQIREHLRKVKPAPHSQTAAGTEAAGSTGWLGPLVRYLLLAIVAAALILVAIRHPYIGRRLLIMVPTLLVISIGVFVIVQLPPGDYLSQRILALEMAGDEAQVAQAEQLRESFKLDRPLPERYARWLGLVWFTTFDAKDKGLLQGSLGRRMQDGKSVNEVVGDSILLTILISLGTIAFTWTLAIPIGIYSAVRQYSPGDYVLTFIGFIGMCIPPFLLALLVIYASDAWLGIKMSGLFSAEYAAQPAWTWGKVVDLLKHIWVPVAVLGAGGTAGMIRVMRGNLLDELKKPYVTTARAKGVRPMKLLFKYPVRLALNPFISGIGALFPMLVSGGAIVAMVLSLPTVGPQLLAALRTEDMYLAGSMLMVLSLLAVFGTLVSDLLLLWLDPRIRFQGGAR